MIVSSIVSLLGTLFDNDEEHDGGGGDEEDDDAEDVAEEVKFKDDDDDDDDEQEDAGPLKLSRSLLVLISEAAEDEIPLPL